MPKENISDETISRFEFLMCSSQQYICLKMKIHLRVKRETCGQIIGTMVITEGALEKTSQCQNLWGLGVIGDNVESLGIAVQRHTVI